VTERAAAPALGPLEVANGLLMGERRQRSTQVKAAKWLRFLTALPIAVDTQTPALAFDPILALARSHKLTAYHAAYLELAMRLGLRLAARDDALEKAAQAVGVRLFAPPRTP
jgi:predicted nucleic acid-binding protein